MAKLLIGCPTHESKNYSILLFCDFLKQATKGKDCDILFVDNSQSDAHKKLIEKAGGFEVVQNTMHYKTKIESIVASRNILINRCLSGGYDALLFVDTDVLIPSDTIDILRKTGKDIIGGVYLGGQHVGKEVKLCPVFFKLSAKGKDFVELAGVDEVMEEKVMEVASIGFGCCLISKKALARVPLRFDKERNCAEDVYFCKDAREQTGLKTYVHTGVKCVHLTLHGDKVIPYEFPRP